MTGSGPAAMSVRRGLMAIMNARDMPLMNTASKSPMSAMPVAMRMAPTSLTKSAMRSPVLVLLKKGDDSSSRWANMLVRIFSSIARDGLTISMRQR